MICAEVAAGRAGVFRFYRRQSPCEEASRSERVRARSSRGRDVGARPHRRDAHAQALVDAARAASVAGVSSLRRGGVSPGGTVVIRRRRRTPQGGQDQAQGRPPSRGFRRGVRREPHPGRSRGGAKSCAREDRPRRSVRERGCPQENQARSQETHRASPQGQPRSRARARTPPPPPRTPETTPTTTPT